jgi:eukaryotic-like serine/threonine-protein kinase
VNEPRSLAHLASDMTSTLGDAAIALGGRRLGMAAALTAGIHLVYTVLYRTVWIAWGSTLGLVTALFGLAMSTLIAFYLLSAPRPARSVVLAGVTYEVLLALTLGLSESTSISASEPSKQASWSAVVIVLFPLLLPARAWVVLSASALAAAMTPVSMAIVFAAEGRPWPPASVVASYVLPPFASALISWAPTRVISQLRAEAQRARRLGSYELVRMLGAGGMGEVWLATHRLLARPAAVKLIKPEVLGATDVAKRTQILRRFEREARVTANLGSPHTVALYDFGVSAEGTLFYVMELLDGVDLETLVERFGPLPPERVVHLLTQACDSLEDAHSRGLIHRDIKPANLFLSRRGKQVDFVKLLDFGLVKRWNRAEDDELARSLAQAGASVDQTAMGKIVGTPAFLAPEAALGEQAVDQRADLYALGCVGYWMLTGQYVFAESSVIAMAIAHISKEPDPPSTRIAQPIAAELEAILMRCLAKDRDARFPSATALREALAACPLPEAWTRERASAWWEQHLGKSQPPETAAGDSSAQSSSWNALSR